MKARLSGAAQRAVLIVVATAAIVLSWSGLVRGGALPTPPPLSSPAATPPPITATATPSPSGKLLNYSGQLLELHGAFAFFTTGDAFRLAPDYKVVDATTGGTTALHPVTRVYARAAFDTGSGAIVQLGLSKRPLPPEASYEQIKGFAVAISTPFPNPDLTAKEGYDGKPVHVIFTVQVPPKTPFADTVYIATDASGWSPTAIKLDRVDALHYRTEMLYPSGTKLLYRYTRGSWQTAEIGQNGLQVTPRSFIVPNADVKRVADEIYGWGDVNPNAPNQSPVVNGIGGTPTPFNPIPFVTPPHKS
jgi:hypothetical protein